MDSGLQELFGTAGAFASLAATLILALLAALYVSQRRDVERLRAWAEREPEHVEADLAASEALLDRAERELEELTGVEPEPPAAARRVTSERPALERVTAERAALAPHPRWGRFASRVTQPRAMIAIGIAAALLAAAAIFGSEQLLSGDEGSRGGGGVDPSETRVAVLNGFPAEDGLAGRVASDLEADGYLRGAVTNAPRSFEESVVFHARGEERAGRRVARRLEIADVEEIDGEIRAIAGAADVVVVAGADRARR